MVWVSNLLLAPQSAKLKLKWFKAFNTREFFVISLLHTSSLIRSHTHTITTRNAISVPKLFHLSWIFSFSFKDVSQWKQSKSGLRIEIHYVWKNGTEWHENKSKSGTFYDLRAIFFLARRPTHILYSISRTQILKKKMTSIRIKDLCKRLSLNTEKRVVKYALEIARRASSKCRNLGGVRSPTISLETNSRKTTKTKTKTGRGVRGCDLGGVSMSGV